MARVVRSSPVALGHVPSRSPLLPMITTTVVSILTVASLPAKFCSGVVLVSVVSVVSVVNNT